MKIIIEYQYFGNIIYYKNVDKCSHIIFEQFENYPKRGFRNKIQLGSSNGIQLLSIPILGGRGIKLPFREVKIDYTTPWQQQHIKTIISLYNRSPWFEYYKNELFDLYQLTPVLLKDWNRTTIEWACSKLKINAIMTETKAFKMDYLEQEVTDLRNRSLKSDIIQQPYPQVFQDKTGFLPNLCVLDLLFCEGPNARHYLSHQG